MKYTLDAGCWNSVMAVPACVVDEYIKLCSGDSLKLLLFLLRHGGSESYTPDVLCERLGIHSEGDLEDAAQFWIQRGLIKIDRSREYDERTVLVPDGKKKTLPAEQLTLADVEVKPAVSASAVKKAGSGLDLYYTSGDAASVIKSDKSMEYLFKEAENLYGHALKSTEVQTVLALTETYGLTAEVALILLSYCFKVGKTTRKYITSTAQDWMENGIDTLEAANQKVVLLEKQSGIEERLRREMELSGKLSKEQREFVRIWSEDWGFGVDMIMLAYDITVNRTGKSEFKYMNSILGSWHSEGVSTEAQVKQRSAARKNTQHTSEKSRAGSNSSFDVEDVLAQIMDKYNTNKT